jgi:hypothetical protein
MIHPPTDRMVYEGEIATYWFDEGILVSLSKSPLRTVENISRNASFVKKITSNKKYPLLIYLAPSAVPGKAARELSKKLLPEIYTAMAMVSSPGLSNLIMKILFKFSHPPIPLKGFTDDKKAREWLKQFTGK